jgi:Histidine phosphatase superfamily (branch 1)
MVGPCSYDCDMEPPGITRHRRPFLAPLWLALLAALIVAGVAWVVYRSISTTVVFLVRATEGAPGSIADPPMTPADEERAQRLAQLFVGGRAAGSVDALYVSDDRRAQQTAAPLAGQLRRPPALFKAADARATAGRLLHEHPGEIIVVVARGDAVRQIARELSDVDLPGATPEENNIAYVVSVPTFGRAAVARLHL